MKRLILILSFWMLFSGCATKEEKELKMFIGDYTKTLQRAYAEANMNLLVPVAMEKELKKMFPVFQAMLAMNSVMPTKVRTFRIKEARIGEGGSSGEIRTYEVWEYWWEDRNTRQVTKKKYEEKYDLRYHVVKDKGVWKVDHIELVEDGK